MKLLNDQPTVVDTLDRLDLVHEVAAAIVDCEPPQVLGIHGDWGLGKTSFLRQLRWYLAGDVEEPGHEGVDPSRLDKGHYADRVTVVWFEAWRYQNEPVPIVALLQEIRGQLAWHAKVREGMKKTAAIAIRGALLAMDDLSKWIGVQAGKVEEAGERWEREHFASVLPANAIQEQLEAAIGHLVSAGEGRDGRRLVVMIDDLDRCEPEAAFRLLEGLKLYLNLPNCVFVLGMNQKTLEVAIGEAGPEKGTVRQARWAAAYLDKMCQVVWRLPLVRDRKTRLVEWLPVPADSRIRRLLANDDLVDDDCLPPNPRRLKAFANVLPRFEARIDAAPGSPAERVQFRMALVVAYIFQFHPALYRHLEAEPLLAQRICDWVRGESPENLPGVLAGLQRGVTFVGRPDAPTPEYRAVPEYSDPSDPDVFWMSKVINTISGDVEPGLIRKFL